MKKKMIWIAAVMLIFVLPLSSCGGNEPAVNPVENPEPEVMINDQAPADEIDQSEEEKQSDQTPEPTSDVSSNLPAEPQPVEIFTSDGRMLEGTFYPARFANAPVVVLMHWAPGSMDDWKTIALWLQNRPGEAPAQKGGTATIHDESWFPGMPEGVSFAVLIFNFGNYGGSQYGGSRESLVLDAQAAFEYGASLPGVDPHRVTAIGASIGADGAVDGCYLFNDAGEKGTCIGVLSLSPGNYLTREFSYQLAAEMINLSGYPVWCLAAEGDGVSPDLCQALPDQSNQSVIFPGSHHGMELIDPEILPTSPPLGLNALELVQEFLEQVYGVTLNDL
jgi:dienelactone hydrolase